MMEKITEDDSYAYFSLDRGPMLFCKMYQACKVIIPPFTDGRFSGGTGWIFPKRSPFLHIIHKWYWKMKEAGLFKRIWYQPKYSPNKLLPKHECETLDGHPISMHKVISLFVMLIGAFSFCLSIFR